MSQDPLGQSSSIHSVISRSFPQPNNLLELGLMLCWGRGLHFRGVACRFFNLWSCRSLSIMASHGIEWHCIAWHGMATSEPKNGNIMCIYLKFKTFGLDMSDMLDISLQPRWHMCMSRRRCFEIGDDSVEERANWGKCGAVSRFLGTQIEFLFKI